MTRSLALSCRPTPPAPASARRRSRFWRALLWVAILTVPGVMTVTTILCGAKRANRHAGRPMGQTERRSLFDALAHQGNVRSLRALALTAPHPFFASPSPAMGSIC